MRACSCAERPRAERRARPPQEQHAAQPVERDAQPVPPKAVEADANTARVGMILAYQDVWT